jgi:hypothetical protein
VIPLPTGRPVTELIAQRTSCRRYAETPIDPERRDRLALFLAASHVGPFGAPVRFELLAADGQGGSALRGLGTYGFIRGATAFIAGAVGRGEKNLEDFGYLMERIVLYATGLDLGTCWLGGTFTKSRFAARIGVRKDEQMPAVVATGVPAGRPYAPDQISRRVAGSDHRLPWEALFFDSQFSQPLTPQGAGAYAPALEMVRLGPSASNKQPWRIVRQGQSWHFFIQRSPSYGRTLRLARLADMPRLDIGIALCHFELTARELGLAGAWQVTAPDVPLLPAHTEYTATWVSEP